MDDETSEEGPVRTAIAELWVRLPETQGSAATVRRFVEIRRLVSAELGERVGSSAQLSLATFQRLFEESGIEAPEALLAVHAVFERERNLLGRDPR